MLAQRKHLIQSMPRYPHLKSLSRKDEMRWHLRRDHYGELYCAERFHIEMDRQKTPFYCPRESRRKTMEYSGGIESVVNPDVLTGKSRR